jgi:hypothetical protein
MQCGRGEVAAEERTRCTGGVSRPSHTAQLCNYAKQCFDHTTPVEASESPKRLRHCYHASSLFSRQQRAEALLTGEELLENDLIRQIKSTEPQPHKVSGEYLDVKTFDLFGTTTHRYLHTTHLIGLEFVGMSFGIEWNIKEPMSKDNCWKARHGIPFIEASSPWDLKVASMDHSRRRKPASLVFHSEYPDWDRFLFLPNPLELFLSPGLGIAVGAGETH